MQKRWLLKYLFFSGFLMLLSLTPVYAMKPVDFKNRMVCGDQYELATANTDGSLTTVACYGDYYSAKNAMNSSSDDNLVVLARAYNKVYGETRTEIADAKVALLDLSVNTQKAYSLFFPDAGDLTGKDNYMDTGSLYRSVDGAFVEVNWPNRVAHVKIAGYDGWVNFISSWTNWLTNDYQIVPLNWVKSSNYYTVSDDAIRHCLTKDIYTPVAESYCINIGPKPDMLSPGTYYSYDGKYFYTDLRTMLQDYRQKVYTRAVNRDYPYYNYYMFLPQHSRTTYSATDIDNYIRNQLKYSATTFDEASYLNGYISKLYGQGTFLYNAQQYYGVNAIVMLGITRNESANGRSAISVDKNNGFGDGAIDGDAYKAAKTYASFANSIYAYARNLFTYGYSNPYDWRYNGSVLGNKGVGMNVQYASDPYWSEKAAKYYNEFDYARNDYNFYQLGVTTTDKVYAYASASYDSKKVYSYDRRDFPMIIVKQEGAWYKVVSDLNIDANKNQIADGPYDWKNSYVYVPVDVVYKINNGKHGFIDPSEVYHYGDYDYTYNIYSSSNNLYDKDTVSIPKVAKLKKDVTFYYDAALTTPVQSSVFSDDGSTRITSARANTYVMVYAEAKDENGKPVAYLITSDYKHNQEDWVAADAIQFMGLSYGKENVDPGRHWAWVNSTPVDTRETVISGFYKNTYFPILDEVVVNGVKWYQVPADMNGTMGYVLASDPAGGCSVTYYQGTYIDQEPTITASDKTIIQGREFDYFEGVSATDPEDGNITKIDVTKTVDVNSPGQYQVTYTVKDNYGHTVSKTIVVTVLKDEEPTITAKDIMTTLGSPKPNLLDNVEAMDKEDGDLSSQVSFDDSKVKYNELGSYEVTYQVKDSFGHIVKKTITLEVKENMAPVIYASDHTITIESTFNPKEGVSAIDFEDGDLTDSIEVVKNEVKTDKLGSYEVTYQVEDSYKNITTKTITVEVIDKSEVEGVFYFDYLKKMDTNLQLRGYMTIQGMDNTLDNDIQYKIIFVNTENENNIYEQEATRITNLEGIDNPIYSPDGYTYTHAWFLINLDIDSLPVGNYIMYIKAEGKDTYSQSIVNNKLFTEEITSYQSSNKVVNIQNNYSNRSSAVTLYIRDNISIPLKTVDSYYNQYDVWDTLEFKNERLYLKGVSYSYGMNLADNTTVNRKIIFENKKTFKTYQFNLGSITNGLYKVALPVADGYDKTRAWYDTTLDISQLPKGDYKVYITTTSNVTDIAELTDLMGRDLSDVKATIADKTYQFKLNFEKGNTIELKVA